MDEAGMVSSPQIERITKCLHEVGARMIVLGDARQLQPIQAGAAFRAFVDVTGYVELDHVVRQKEPWMREAAIAFGSGHADRGVEAYLNRNRFDWSDTNEEARAALIEDWLPYHQADITIIAHRNRDVIALNREARKALKEQGALRNEHSFATERGQRFFAEGDRIVFLKNDVSSISGFGVFNGSTGTVLKAAPDRLVALVDGSSNAITIQAGDYNALDHGYARTIHKEQGNTVDHAFVYLSPTMDAQLSYVALTRHRDDVKLYASKEDFEEGVEGLRAAMTRDRLQDSTILYRDNTDYQNTINRFAERRGFPSSESVLEFIRSNVAALRERFEKLAATFNRIRGLNVQREINTAAASEKTLRSHQAAIPDPLLKAAPTIAKLSPVEIRSRAIKDDGIRPSLARAGDIAWRMYQDHHAALQTMLDRYGQTGDASKVLDELTENPASFGELNGQTRLGFTDAKRRSALKEAPQLAESATHIFQQIAQAEARIIKVHNAQRAAKSKPLPDLSETAQHFLAKAVEISKFPISDTKANQMNELLKDTTSLKEIISIRKALTERYGKGPSSIQQGLTKELALGDKTAPEQQATIERVNVLLNAFPVLTQMPQQIKQHQQSKDLTKTHYKAIER